MNNKIREKFTPPDEGFDEYDYICAATHTISLA